EPGPQHVERAPPPDLTREAQEEALLHLGAVVLPQPLPLLGLGSQDEIVHVPRDQAERAVVMLGALLPISPRHRIVAVGRRRLPDRSGVARAGIGPVPEERALDRLLEIPLCDLDRHATLSR